MKVRVRRCSSWNARVIWTETVHGKRMPVDATPRQDGNIRLERRQERDGDTIVAHYDQPTLLGDSGSEQRYVSHFTTCPQSKEWRKD